METGQHYSPGDFIISSDSYVIYEYCTNTSSDGQCIERTQVIPYSSLKNQSLANTEGYGNTAVFVIVIMLLVRLVKGIFRLIFPSRGKN